MTLSMYAASLPVFKQMLSSLNTILSKAEEQAAAKKIDEQVLLQSRLFPDMFPLMRQVQVATDFAKSVSARLAGVELPDYESDEKTITDLKARISKTLSFIENIEPSQLNGSEEREIVTQAGTPKEKRFTGHAYLLTYGLPHFFFHVTTAYNILRHNGFEIGKRDYIG